MVGKMRMAIMLAVLLTWNLLLLSGESNLEAQTGKRQDGLYYVIIKQAEIKGQVFVLIGEDEGTSRPASEVPVVVQDPERAAEIMTVKTDRKGVFTLPNLEKGEYLLKVSKLKLRLKIIEETEETIKAMASKIIVVFLPPEMIVQ